VKMDHDGIGARQREAIEATWRPVDAIWHAATLEQRVLALLALQGLSLRKFADKTPLSVQAWSKALRSKRVSARHLYMIQRSLEISLDALMMGVEPDDLEEWELEWLNSPMGPRP